MCVMAGGTDGEFRGGGRQVAGQLSGSISGGNPGNSTVVITGIEKHGLGVHKLGHDFSSHFLPGFIVHNCDTIGHAVMLANQKKGADPYENARRWIKAHPEKVSDWTGK